MLPSYPGEWWRGVGGGGSPSYLWFSALLSVVGCSCVWFVARALPPPPPPPHKNKIKFR
jgi:hypothetical protein